MFEYENDRVSALGFSLPFIRIVNHENVEEYHVDSTFKTNQLGYELFGVIATVHGVGFPIAYMLLRIEPSASNITETRTSIITQFFEKLCDNEHLRPAFFFSDKDMGQINAIEHIWG